MNYQNFTEIELQKFYHSTGFFILNDLPNSSEFSIDGQTSIIGSRFQGIKLIPTGFHLITFIPGYHQEIGIESKHISQEIKQGIIRFYKPKEIIMRNYCKKEERIQESSSSSEIQTISSIDYMKSIDFNLAPYPIELYSIWKSLSCFITIELVEEVYGIDERGDSILDSLMCNQEEEEDNFTSSSHKRDLSSSYPHRHHHQVLLKNQIKSNQKFTNWPKINLKRSWPKDSIGESLSKWSQDKSYLFHQFILNSCQNDLNKFLGYLQLSFLTFLNVHSFQSLKTYQTLLNLLTKSTIQELKNFNSNYITIIIIQSFQQLVQQLKSFSNDFFIELQDPQLENWFFKIINLFKSHLNQILSDYQIYQDLIQSHWNSLQIDCQRFDWNIKGLKTIGTEVDSDEEEEEEESEEEDEKPVIVES